MRRTRFGRWLKLRRKRKNDEYKEIGLSIALAANKHLLKTDHLHFGIWPEGLEVDLDNLPEAQRNHTQLILNNIPEGVKTILDVGCGSGRLAHDLTQQGYDVECVCPSEVLSENAAKLLGDASRIHISRYEDFETTKRYDMVLFSESFQYIPMADALPRSLGLLNEGGHVLLFDFFKKDVPGKSPLRGGHAIDTFYSEVSEQPLEIEVDLDLTKEIAPSMDLTDQLLRDMVQPMWHSARLLVSRRHPWLSKLAFWWFRAKLDKIDGKYFSGERNGENFIIHKTYRLVRMRSVVGQPATAQPPVLA